MTRFLPSRRAVLRILPGSVLLSATKARATPRARPRVLWLISGKVSGFWPVAEVFGHAAAGQLGLDLEVRYYNNHPGGMIATALEAVAGPTPPDVLMFHNYKHQGESVLRLAGDRGIPALIINAGFGPGDHTGPPRGTYPHWLGTLTPDDEAAGAHLARLLFAHARATSAPASDGRWHVVAIEGLRESTAANARLLGLHQALREAPDMALRGSHHGRWRRAEAARLFASAHAAAPEATIYWTASDSMALGIAEAARASGLTDGALTIGGIDMLPTTLAEQARLGITVSVGGHYVEPAWAMVLLADYFAGLDFADTGRLRFRTTMSAATPGDLSAAARRLADGGLGGLRQAVAAIDFRRFCRAHAPDWVGYDFRNGLILEQIGLTAG